MPTRRPLLAAALALLLLTVPAAPLPGASRALAQANVPLQPGQVAARSIDVFGYLPYWEIDSSIDAYLRYDVLDTIALFGVTFRADGSFNTTDASYATVTGTTAATIIQHAHAAGDRVVMTFESFNADHNAQFLSDPQAPEHVHHERHRAAPAARRGRAEHRHRGTLGHLLRRVRRLRGGRSDGRADVRPGRTGERGDQLEHQRREDGGGRGGERRRSHLPDGLRVPRREQQPGGQHRSPGHGVGQPEPDLEPGPVRRRRGARPEADPGPPPVRPPVAHGHLGLRERPPAGGGVRGRRTGLRQGPARSRRRTCRCGTTRSSSRWC